MPEENDNLVTTGDGRVELSIPVPAEIWTAERMWGNRPKDLVLRGQHTDVGQVLTKALADLTGNSFIAELDGAELATALVTLGEIMTHGLDVDLKDMLSEHQISIGERIGQLWSERHLGCGWCGSGEHDQLFCPDDPDKAAQATEQALVAGHDHGDYSDVQ